MSALILKLNKMTQEQTKSIEEILKPYVEKILQGLEQGVDYATQQIPIILKQYIMYEAITSWLLVLFSVVMFYLFWMYFYKNLRNKRSWFYYTENDDEITDYAGNVMSITGVIITLVSMVLFFLNIETAIKATFFPKLFLVEKFIELF